MKILFILSLIVFYLELIYVKKMEGKQNILISLIYSALVIFFYNLIISFVLSSLNIRNTLDKFLFIYLLTTIIVYLYYKKKYKKIPLQKYYLEKKQLIHLIIIIIICLTIGIVRFYPDFKSINYKINDSATHYKMAYDYSNNQKLLDESIDSVFDYNNPIFGYYVPCGLFMELMPFSKIVSYNVFNTIILCLLSTCFYITLLMINKKSTFFTFLLTILYTLAYPLNYMIFGFGYLGVGVLATNLIILTLKKIEKHDKKYLYILLNIFNFGLFGSYYLFVPVVYLSEIIYLLYFQISRKYEIKKIIMYLSFCLLIPSIFGMNYFILKSSISSHINAYSIDGYSYQDLIGNYILLIPIVTYSLYCQAKKNILDFDMVFIIILLLYIIATFMFIGNGYVSSYYFYKAYHILWLIVNIFIYKFGNYKKFVPFLKIQYALILITIVFSFIDVEKSVSKKDQMFEYSGILPKLSHIYVYNKKEIFNNNKIESDKIELIKKARQCTSKSKKNTIPYITNKNNKWWFYAINNISPIAYQKKEKYRYDDDDIDSRFIKENKKIKCILIDREYLKENIELIKEDYIKVFENKAGILYKTNQ